MAVITREQPATLSNPTSDFPFAALSAMWEWVLFTPCVPESGEENDSLDEILEFRCACL